MAPKVRYARSGDIHIAYATLGDGPIDVVFVPGFVSNLNATPDPEQMPVVNAWIEREHELKGVPDRWQVYAASSAS